MSLKEQCKSLQEQIVVWRRDLHKRPEIGLVLPETEAYIAARLKEFGVEVTCGVGGHGVVGLLRGEQPGQVIGIRADMDGLLVSEDTGLRFASEIPGRMHACGHDGHMAMALGAARVLAENRHRISGAVKFIFQPGEEGPGGALPMIADGVLENPKVDAIIGAHLGTIWPLETGQVGYRSGALMAAVDSMRLKIYGRGGHGAMPHTAIDPIAIGAQCVTALQTIVSRETDPLNPAVITVATFHAGTLSNVIADFAELGFTIRYFDPALSDTIETRLRQLVSGIVESMRGRCEIEYTHGYPPTVNDAEFTRFFRDVASDVIGAENVVEVEPTMGSEDMSFFLERVQGTYFGLGSPPKQSFAHHHPKFDIDEDALWVGAALFAETAVRWLART